MGLYDEFRFRPASWLPHSELPLEELERVRNIRREDMEYTNENGYSVRVVLDPTLCMVQDMFYRIVKSDLEDKPFSMICLFGSRGDDQQVQYQLPQSPCLCHG